jgi:hypothetical protein
MNTFVLFSSAKATVAVEAQAAPAAATENYN